MERLTAIVARMSEIRMAMDDVAGRSGHEQAALQRELEALREEASVERLRVPSTRNDLEAELARCLARWDALQAIRIDVVKHAGGSAAGDFGQASDAMVINRAIDSANSRAKLEARIHELRALLARAESG